MAKECVGGVAPYNPSEQPLKGPPLCTYCVGSGSGTLSSTSYASCVGLVLYHKESATGVVAHFPGSMGAEKWHDLARTDTLEILAKVAAHGGAWKSWVFGGASLAEKPLPSTAPNTKALIDLIRDKLDDESWGQSTSPAKKVTHQLGGGYVGYRGVTLNLADGKVTFEEAKTAKTLLL